MRIRLGLSARLVMTVATAAMLSACSNSIERFSAAYDNPSDADPVYTASVPKSVQKVAKKRPVYEEPVDEIAMEEPIVSKPLKKASLGAAPKPVYDYSTSYSKKKPAYKQPKLQLDTSDEPVIDREPAYEVETVEAPVAKKVKKTASLASTPGGKIRVEPGMTLYSIARANGLTVQQLGEANGLSEPFTVPAGTVLTVPGATSVKTPATSLQAQKRQIEQETPDSLAEEEAVIEPVKKFKKTKPVETAELEEPVVTTKPSKKAKLTLDEEPVAADDSETAIGEQVVAKTEVKPKTKPVEKVAALDVQPSTPASTEMKLRWPVVGKVISEYGQKPNGMKNEGINIAVPEGTSVRAAEEGTVAYAGNELKGYGNLILVRHAGGYVTAYAHAKEILVKRGDKVKRGDIIARAGQTGAVSSPQLHFEVRKGASALDPSKFLRSSTAMN